MKLYKQNQLTNKKQKNRRKICLKIQNTNQGKGKYKTNNKMKTKEKKSN